jgi:hypothetical protein
MVRVCLLLGIVLAACSKDPIPVGDPTSDYKLGELQAAVDRFVEAGRTPAAYSELARTIFTLRPAMDRATAEIAELRLVVLAIEPVRSVAQQPLPAQVDALALTVWPALLAGTVEPDDILRKLDPIGDLQPEPRETPVRYVERLCGDRLAGDCKHIVPEYQGHVVSAIAIRRGMERTRVAVSDCVTCSSELGWKAAVRAWEELDRAVNATIYQIERTASPSNWPMAGAAAVDDPRLPEAEVTATGELVIGGQRYGATTRIDALRELRFQHGGSSPIALHIRPETTLASVKGLLADVRKSGATRVAVIARDVNYPWNRKIYWISDRGGVRAGLRPSDSLQLLLHAADHLGAPGTVVRVD